MTSMNYMRIKKNETVMNIAVFCGASLTSAVKMQK